MRTFLFRKIILMFFGIFLVLFFLETGLRIGGLIFERRQDLWNWIALQQKGAYRVMCIGESTTQGQYPIFLQYSLNKHSTGRKFSVIDEGVGATYTSLIASRLEENIKKYTPDMVVAMMGINDGGAHMPVEFNSLALEENIGEKLTPSRFLQTFPKRLKLYKLMQWALLHLQSKLKGLKNDKQHDMVPFTSEKIKKENHQNSSSQQNVLSNEGSGSAANTKTGPDISYDELGIQLHAQGDIVSAKRAFKKAIATDPYGADAYFRLAWLSDPTEREELFTQVLEVYKKVVEAGELSDLHDFQLVLIGERFTQGNKRLNEVEELFKKILVRDPKNVNACFFLGVAYEKQRRYAAAEEFFKRTIALNDHDLRAFDHLGVLYHDTGKFDLSEQYLRKANELRHGEYPLLTAMNYKKIKKILDAHKIKLVCVQYPMRNIKYLKEIFDKENDIIFVDNEQVFKSVLRKRAYKDLFRDIFAGDFGHCTIEGNKLLADNIAAAILKEVSGKA